MPQIVVKLGDDIIQNYSFDKEILNVGRSRDNDISLDNLAVSRSHCRIRNVEGKFIVTDLNSANGTYVNGVKISKTEVIDEDVISIGKHKLIFELNEMKEEEVIGDAFGADRTMIVESTTEGALTLTKGKNRGQKCKISKYETILGRAAECDVVINDWFASKTHAKIIKQSNSYIIKDLGSWKGTYLNDKQIKEATPLKNKDEIRIGSTRFEFEVIDENKELQESGRRPQELGYDASGASALPGDIPPPLAVTGPSVASASDPAAALRPSPSVEAEIRPTMQMEALEPKEEVELIDDAGRRMGGASVEIPSPLAPDAPDDEFINVNDLDIFKDDPSEEAFDHTPAMGTPVESRASEGSLGDDVVWSDIDPPSSSSDSFAAISSPSLTPPPTATPFPNVTPFPSDTPPTASPPSPPTKSASTPSAPSLPGLNSAPSSGNMGQDSGAGDDRLEKQIHMWERAMTNKSPVIRQHAAKMLKKLTGKDYDTE